MFAGVVVVFDMIAVRADAQMTALCGRAAGANAANGFALVDG